MADRCCSKCKRPLRGRYWIGLLEATSQCDRVICRIRSGHLFWMTFHRRLAWKPLLTIRISRPWLAKGP
jgi:hypothetical protein